MTSRRHILCVGLSSALAFIVAAFVTLISKWHPKRRPMENVDETDLPLILICTLDVTSKNTENWQVNIKAYLLNKRGINLFYDAGVILLMCFRKNFKRKHGVYYSVFLELPYFDPIKFGCIDPMHCMWQNVTKTCFAYLTGKLRSKVCNVTLPLTLPTKDIKRSDSSVIIDHCIEDDIPYYMISDSKLGQDGTDKQERKQRLNTTRVPATSLLGLSCINAFWSARGVDLPFGVESGFETHDWRQKDNGTVEFLLYWYGFDHTCWVEKNLLPHMIIKQLSTQMMRSQGIIGDRIFLDADGLKKFDRAVDDVEAHDSIGRIPSHGPTEWSSRFKADTWRNLATSFALPLLYDHKIKSLSGIKSSDDVDEYRNTTQQVNIEIRHLLTHLSQASKIMSSSAVSDTDIANLRTSLDGLVRSFAIVYGEHALTPNFHLVLHIPECMINYGPAHAFWTFAFERMNGMLIRVHTNRKDPGQTMVKHFDATQRWVRLADKLPLDPVTRTILDLRAPFKSIYDGVFLRKVHRWRYDPSKEICVGDELSDDMLIATCDGERKGRVCELPITEFEFLCTFLRTALNHRFSGYEIDDDVRSSPLVWPHWPVFIQPRCMSFDSIRLWGQTFKVKDIAGQSDFFSRVWCIVNVSGIDVVYIGEIHRLVRIMVATPSERWTGTDKLTVLTGTPPDDSDVKRCTHYHKLLERVQSRSRPYFMAFVRWYKPNSMSDATLPIEARTFSLDQFEPHAFGSWIQIHRLNSKVMMWKMNHRIPFPEMTGLESEAEVKKTVLSFQKSRKHIRFLLGSHEYKL